jgi:hypothetical protein
MGYKKDDPCIKKAYDDERLFVLMTRDAAAPATVIDWIKYSLLTQPAYKLHEALDCAIQMSREREAIEARKQEDQDAVNLKDY